LIYITVGNLDISMDSCCRNGGTILSGPRSVAGHGRYCVIQDPAGAVAALFEKSKERDNPE
jgi:predicted enzyme related to lactoylglutathione lyase